MRKERNWAVRVRGYELKNPRGLWVAANSMLELAYFSAGFFVLLPFLAHTSRLNWLTLDLKWLMALIVGLTAYALATTYVTARAPATRHKQQSLLAGAFITLVGTLAFWLSDAPPLGGPDALWFVIGGAMLMAGATLVSAVTKSYLHHLTTQQNVGFFLGVNSASSISAAIITLLFISTLAWSPEINQELFETLCRIVPLCTGTMTVSVALAASALNRDGEEGETEGSKVQTPWQKIGHVGTELRKTLSLRYLLLSRFFCAFAFCLTGFLFLSITTETLSWTYFQIACLALAIGVSWAFGSACAGYVDLRIGARAALGFGTLVGTLLLLSLGSVFPDEAQLAGSTTLQEADFWVIAMVLAGSMCVGFLNVANDTLIARFSSSKDFLLWFSASTTVTTIAFLLAAVVAILLSLTDNTETSIYLTLGAGCLSLLLLKPVKSDISLIIHADTSLTDAYPRNNMSGGYAL